MEVGVDNPSEGVSHQIEKRKNVGTNTASCSENIDSTDFSAKRITFKPNSVNIIEPQHYGSSVKHQPRRRSIEVLNRLRKNSIQMVNSFWTSIEGILYALLSAFFFSLTTLIVKHLDEVNTGIKAFFRFLGIFLFSIPMAYDYGGTSLRPLRLHIWALLRGAAGGISIYVRYWSIRHLPLANATVIVVSMPVFVCIFSRIFLREKCGVFHIFTIGITLLGFAVMTKSSNIFDEHQESKDFPGYRSIYSYEKGMLAMGAAFLASLIGAASYILVRQMKFLHHSVILFDFGWIAMMETAGITYYFESFDLPQICSAPWLLMVLAVSSFYAQFLLTKALIVEEAGLVSLTRSSLEVFLAFVYQIFIFNQIPDNHSLAGALLITCAVVLTGIRKYVSTLPPEHRGRIIFAFTLR